MSNDLDNLNRIVQDALEVYSVDLLPDGTYRLSIDWNFGGRETLATRIISPMEVLIELYNEMNSTEYPNREKLDKLLEEMYNLSKISKEVLQEVA